MNQNVVPLWPEFNESASFPFHGLANVLPLLEGERFEELVSSIQDIGQIDPITLLDGSILDGRNRYRTCLRLGIQPRFEDLKPGIDPVKFVVGRNISRRDLTLSQRSYAMAQFATYKRGGDTTQDVSNRNNVPIAQPDSQPTYTVKEAAEIADSNVKYIQYGKIVMNEGTAEEKEAVRNGTANIRSVAKKITARRPESAPPAPSPQNYPTGQRISNGPRLKIPDDMTISGWCRRGMEWEAAGRGSEDVAKELGWDVKCYRHARDICLLFDRDDLCASDRRLVADTYAEMNETKRSAAAYAKVRCLAERIWGTGRQRSRAEKQRVDAFDKALIVIEATCERAAELEIPYLNGAVIRETMKQVDKAIENLRKLRSKLNRKEMA